MNSLKPCPFCGVKPVIQLTDGEGNFRPNDYLSEPYSGVGFVLRHNVEWDECPIATVDDESLGNIIYDSEEEAIFSWNRRIED